VPTGHTLRLLALPEQARAWVQQLMAVLLKYRAVGAFAPIAEELLGLSRGLDDLQRLLTTASACGVVVTRAEQLPSLETARLVEWLARRRVARRALLVNALTPAGCARCRRIAARERREIAAFTRRTGWPRGTGGIVATDAVVPPPRGPAALQAWQGTWRVLAVADAAAPDGRGARGGQ
jgi:anion-transporting  ArsA/GET3 family ATPase